MVDTFKAVVGVVVFLIFLLAISNIFIQVNGKKEYSEYYNKCLQKESEIVAKSNNNLTLINKYYGYFFSNNSLYTDCKQQGGCVQNCVPCHEPIQNPNLFTFISSVPKIFRGCLLMCRIKCINPPK